MLTLLLAAYVIPVYLIFFRMKWIKLNALWWTVIITPPVVAGLFLWFAMGRYVPSTQEAYVQAMVVQVSPQVNAEVEEVFVRENQLVTTGTPLFKLDASAYQQKADQAKAQFIAAQEASASTLATLAISQQALEAAQSQVQAAKHGTQAAAASAAAAAAVVSSANAQAQLAVTNLKRSEALIASQDISQQEFDGTKSSAETAVAQLRKAELDESQAKAGVAAAESQEAIAVANMWQTKASLFKAEMLLYPIKTLESGIQFAQDLVANPTVGDVLTTRGQNGDLSTSSVRDRTLEISWMQKLKTAIEPSSSFLGDELPPERAARESLNTANRDLKNSEVKSPAAGWVTGLHIAPGTYARSGGPMLSIVVADQWWLTANLPENYLVGVRPGDKVLYSLRNYPGKLRTGTVSSISRGIIQGQGLPNGMLPDTKSRITRQTDTPQMEGSFQVSINIQDDINQPLRVGQTGRALIYASGGFPVVNTVFTIIAYLNSYMDLFFPKPSIVLILIGIAAGVYFFRKRKKVVL